MKTPLLFVVVAVAFLCERAFTANTNRNRYRETTTGFDSTNIPGHHLGFMTKSGKGIPVDALGGYAYGLNSFTQPFQCSGLSKSSCSSQSQYCEWKLGKCEFKKSVAVTKMLGAVQNSIPDIPKFKAKLSLHVRGIAHNAFVDIDTRTRLGQMEQFRSDAVAYFYETFGLDFSHFNTYEGAQMIPFKLSDELFLQVVDAYLPKDSVVIPERNRVLIDGFMVKPMYGESVVLGGTYAALKNDITVHMEEDEVLWYFQYRIVDDQNRLYLTFTFKQPFPLKTNNVGVSGWTATVESEDSGFTQCDGLDTGTLEIIEGEGGLVKVTWNSMIVFPENSEDRADLQKAFFKMNDRQFVVEEKRVRKIQLEEDIHSLN